MTTPPGAPRRSALLIIYGTVFIDLLGFGIILPALPYYARALDASGFELGVLFTAYSLAQLVGAAVLGRLSDRLGRRPVLLASLAGSAISMTLAGFARTLPILYLARAAAGLFGGSISTAQAYIADVTPREERAKYMGLLGASIGMGFVIGPALGALVLYLGGGFAGTAFVAAGLAALNLLFAAFKLPESRVIPRPSDPGGVGARGEGVPMAPDSRRPPPRRWLAALGRPELRPALLATFLTMAAFVSMETTLAYLVDDCLGLSDRQFGVLLAVIGVAMAAIQGGAIGPLTRWLGVRAVAVAGSASMSGGMALVALIPLVACSAEPRLGSWLILAGLAMGLLALGQGLSSPSLSTLLSTASGDDEQGEVLGVGRSLGAAARAFAPLVAGALYDAGQPWPFVLAAVLALLAALLVSRERW